LIDVCKVWKRPGKIQLGQTSFLRSGGVAQMSLELMAVILTTLRGLCPHCLMVRILMSRI
jgi:hypothetical protein